MSGLQTVAVKQPCSGVTLMRTPAGMPVLRIHYTANPEMTGERLATERAKYSTDAYWRQEMEIEDDALEGQRVYPDFDPAIHVIPDSQIPKRGCRYMAIDPHPRTPHAALWVLIDWASDWYVYRELWRSTVYGQTRNLRDTEQDNAYTIREYAEAIAWLEGNNIEWRNPETDDEYGLYRRVRGAENIIYRFMDQAGKGFQASDEAHLLESYAKRYDRYGIQCIDPQKSHQSGEDAIRQLLKVRHHDLRGFWPRLHIAASCVELQLELLRFRYQMFRKYTETRELKQQGMEVRRHLIDCLRYLATGQLGYVRNLES